MNIFFLLLTLIFQITCWAAQISPQFVIIIPSYNNEQWCIKNIKSCTQQQYPNWHLYYINDASTDKTGDLIASYIKKNNLQDRCTLIHNLERKGALQNIYNTIHILDPKKVVVLVDGDDFLKSPTVLNKVAKAYKKDQAWMTYGNYIDWPNRNPGWCELFPSEVFKTNSFRRYKWVASHLRTFYAGLFQKIKKSDLQYKGKFYSVAWDLCMMFPMLEMSGSEHVVFIKELLYVYNRSNPISDFRIQRKLQVKFEKHIRQQSPYKHIKKLL